MSSHVTSRVDILSSLPVRFSSEGTGFELVCRMIFHHNGLSDITMCQRGPLTNNTRNCTSLILKICFLGNPDMVKYNYSELTENWYIDRSTTNRFALCDGMGVWCWGAGGGKGGGVDKIQRSFYCQILAHHGKNKGHRLLYICRKLLYKVQFTCIETPYNVTCTW